MAIAWKNGAPRTEMPRVVRLLDRYDLKVAFYVPGWIIERDPTPAGNGIWSQQDVWGIWVEEFEGQYEEGGFFNLAEYWLAQGH